jgi:hypothetical protein
MAQRPGTSLGRARDAWPRSRAPEERGSAGVRARRERDLDEVGEGGGVVGWDRDYPTRAELVEQIRERFESMNAKEADIKSWPGAPEERRAEVGTPAPRLGSDVSPSTRDEPIGELNATPLVPFVQVRSSKLVQLKPGSAPASVWRPPVPRSITGSSARAAAGESSGEGSGQGSGEVEPARPREGEGEGVRRGRPGDGP